MTSKEYWCALYNERKILKYSDGQQGNALCRDQNQTDFEIPDPDEMPEEVREEMLREVLANTGAYALGY